jgi:predicted nucleotidyltransferase
MASPAVPKSRIAREALALLAATPGQQLHTREIARRVDADAHPVQRALERMLDDGVVESRRLGNLRLWSLRETEVTRALRDVIRRTAGLARALRTELSSMRGVQVAFLFGSYAAGDDKPGSDVDLFVVGAPDWRVLSRELGKQSGELGREINPIVWSIEELERPTATQARFLRRLMRKPKIWLVGDADDFGRLRSPMGGTLGSGSPGSTGGGRSRRGAAPARAGLSSISNARSEPAMVATSMPR